jgi:hypothetical protein
MQGGQVMTHGMRLLPITLNYATGIFNGDLVQLTSGFLTKTTGTTGIAPIGVFIGCEYEDASLGLFHRAFWPASQAIKTGTTAWGYVIDDPDVLFEIQADGAVAATALGLNANVVQGAGIVATGKSQVALATAGIAATATFPLRIVDLVRKPGNAFGAGYTDLIVRINTHANRTA